MTISDPHELEVLEFTASTRAPRFDSWLTAQLKERGDGLSRTQIQNALRAGHVTCNGVTVTDPGCSVPEGAHITLKRLAPVPLALTPEPRPLDILYEDDSLLVLNKPPGLVVHPAPGHAKGTLVHALLAHCGSSLSGIGGVQRPGIVHRLDKDTSGLMVVAKTDQAHQSLSQQFADHGRTGPLERLYHGLVWGTPHPPRGAIERPIGRHTHNREKMSVVAEGRGRWATTHYKVIKTFTAPENSLKNSRSIPLWRVSLMHFQLETGRTHQIRVHCGAIGHPLLGDPVYGSHFSTKSGTLPCGIRAALTHLARPALHAAVLGFAHPKTGATLHFERPPPDDFCSLLEALELGV